MCNDHYLLKLLRMKGSRYILMTSKGFMGTLQAFLARVRDSNHVPITEIDRLIAEAMHEYCWAWNKMEKGEMGKEINNGMNGKHDEQATFDAILEEKLKWWAEDRGIDLTTVTDLECTRCQAIIPRIDVLRCKELGQEPRCNQCPGQDFMGNTLALVPVKGDVDG